MTEEYSAEVKNLENAMVRKLSGNLAPIGTLKTAWDQLLYSLSNDNPLSQAEIQGISTMQKLFDTLKDKKFIDYGNYGHFEDRLRPIHPNMASTVFSFQTNIIAQIKKDSENSRKNLPITDEETGGNADDGDDKDKFGKTAMTRMRQKGVHTQVTDTMASDEQESEYVYSQTVQELHNDMITELDEEIAPRDGMMDTWNTLLQCFSSKAPLSTKQIHGIKKIGDLVGLLMNDKYISFGNYEPFAEKLDKAHKAMASLVRGYSDKIKKQITKERESQR